MRLRPGDTFDRYVIEAPLGEGGMGEVYQARDTRLHRRVALKLLRREGAADTAAWQRAVGRMLREARAAAALSHPNTVAIYDIGEMDGAPYLAMEFIDGVTLRQLIAGSSSSPRRLSWLVDVARALSAAHREGLVHRDIKPENVMLRDDGMIKVLDFGIARKMRLGLDTRGSTLREADLEPPSSRKGETLTGEGVMVGTPAYMAPEQLRGDTVDARTDQFGWGVLAYELLTGQIPFGPNLEGVRLLSAILADDPPSLEGIVPPAVERILRKTVSKRPADRYPSMDHVIEALLPFVTGDGLAVPEDVLISDADSEAIADTSPAERSSATSTKESVATPRSAGAPTPRTGGSPSNTVRSPSPVAGARSRGMTPPSVRIEKAAPPPPLRPPSLTTLESPTAVAVRTAQRGAGQRKWPLIAAATIAVLGVLVLSAGIISRLRRKSEATAPAPAPTTVATAVTELPLPATSNAEALAAYREGLQRLRNASWSLARNAFEQATKLDPSLGAAYLRMAIIDRCHFQTALSRSGFQRAVELRTSLTEREQLLLDAFEPVIQRDPPDWMETRNRLEAAKQKYPGDAEFIVMVMIGYQMELPPERMLELTDQCLELDDRYADCWQGRALALFRSERIPEAIEALDHCLELAPAATDCLTERIRLQKIMGRCGRLEADARRWLTKDQSFPFAYQELAVALEAGGQSLGAVGAAVEQAARRFREAGMPEAAGRLRINLALLSGHFDEAERLATQLARDMAGESQEDKHAVPALALVRLYWETGQDRKAGEVADDFLSRRAGWVRPVRWTPWSDPEPRFLKAKHRAGLLDDAGYVAARDGWVRGWQAVDADPAALWLIGKAAVAHTEAEARAALSESLVKAPYALHPQGDVSLTIALLGDLAFLSGRYDEALPRLEEAARSCTALDDPIRHTVATYRLGVVHESRKEKAKACAAYKVVLRRWAQADGSLTAKDAARRAKELACAD